MIAGRKILFFILLMATLAEGSGMIAINNANVFNYSVNFHPRQMTAYKALKQPGDVECAYGGAKGGGKSYFGCQWVILESLEIIQKYGLEPSDTPLLIGFMGRKRNSDFVKTTLETWKKEIPSRLYTINESKQEIVILGTVKWYYGGFDDRSGVEKFNSGEYCRLFIDQAEEITEHEYAMVGGTMRLKIKGYTPEYKELYTCNPAQCWLKREFVRNPKLKELGRVFIQALPKDNVFLAKGYVAKLRHKYRNQPELLEAYIEGSWDAVESENQLIKEIWIRESKDPFHLPAKKRKIIACDVARFGDDRTVIGYALETDLQEVQIFGKKRADYVVNKIERMAIKHSEDGSNKTTPLIVIDADGLGGPIADMLLSHGFRVLEINSASESSNQGDFYNLRAEMWWNASQMYSDGDVYNSYGDMGADDIQELDTELTVVGYSLRAGRILVEGKDQIKDAKHYGKSPDIADMYIMLLYGLNKIVPEKVAEANRRRARNRAGRSAMAG